MSGLATRAELIGRVKSQKFASSDDNIFPCGGIIKENPFVDFSVVSCVPGVPSTPNIAYPFRNLQDNYRIGEARVPGPFRISTINPTQIHGHVEDITDLRHDVCTTAENSATIDAQRVAHHQFKKNGINSLWSAPVQTISQNSGTFRGRASGVSIHTSLPISPIAVDLPADIRESARLLDGIVHLNHKVCCHVGVVYGPPHNDTFANPVAILNRLTFVAAERAVTFKGPAVLTGDWNVDLEKAEVWKFLAARGWIDAASVAAQWHHRLVQPTCRNVARKSFILLNPLMAQALNDCFVIDNHVFAQHPVLTAEFDLDVCIQDRMVWHLPHSTDEFIFDDQLLEEHAHKYVEESRVIFECAVDNHDVDSALNIFVQTWEKTLCNSAVSSDGQTKTLPKACLGRCSKFPWKSRNPSCPIIRFGRSGDYNPQVTQANASIRRHTKQLRRIQSLERQVFALQRNHNEAAKKQCEQLWNVIVQANGYHKNFSHWMLKEMGFFIPGNCPPLDFIAELRHCFRNFVDTEVLAFQADQTRRRKLSVAIDIAKGGSGAFKSLKQSCVPPVGCLAKSQTFMLKRFAWTKSGTNTLFLSGNDMQPFAGSPITFQGQEAWIDNVDGCKVCLDRKVKLRKGKPNDLFFTQTFHARHDEMLEMISSDWNQFWQRDERYNFDDVWDSITERFHTFDDCPTCEYVHFNHDEWYHMLNKVSNKSARGSCAFTIKELRSMPKILTQWLFDIYHLIEKGERWPSSLVQARVVMIPKQDRPPERWFRGFQIFEAVVCTASWMPCKISNFYVETVCLDQKRYQYLVPFRK